MRAVRDFTVMSVMARICDLRLYRADFPGRIAGLFTTRLAS